MATVAKKAPAKAKSKSAGRARTAPGAKAAGTLKSGVAVPKARRKPPTR